MEIGAFQKVIRDTYFDKDKKRGISATYMYLMEEVGELATALREGSREAQVGEFADVLAWLMTLANLAEVDMEGAIMKYTKGCSGCGKIPCLCTTKP